jgi:hypothetical protein
MTAPKTPVQKHTERVQREARDRERQTQRRANPPQSPEQMREAFKDLDSIDILDRRLTNPEAELVLPIRLKDEPSHAQDPQGAKRRWYLRWFNTSIPNRFHSATASQGYVPVLWEELQDREIVSNAFGGSDQVRRGDRGVEVLCKMPLVYYLAIKKKQREKHDRAMSPKALRNAVAREAVKAGLDPEQHEEVGQIVGDIKVGRERLVSALDE